MRKVLAAVTLVAALGLSSCGSGSDSHASDPPASTGREDVPGGATVDSTGPNVATPAPAGATATGHYAVTGTVKDAIGRPVVGFLVTFLVTAKSLTGQGVPELAVLTDGRGRYRWPSRLACRYELLVRTDARQASGQVTVTPPGPASLDLKLGS